ncbi:T9SS type A sorting domain-containing protein [Winogradskyella endarachnes]|nr:T9SS type A sorting domain-containing protein [Winogradskyella endarachnes]
MSQSISFVGIDDSVTDYNLSDVQKIIFGLSDVSIYLNNDQVISIPLDEFKNYHYSQETLGSEDFIMDSESFKVFPNPTQDVFKISFESKSAFPYTYKIYDITGRAVLQKELGSLNGLHTETISVKEFPSGVYFVELKSGSLKSSKKLIKL